MILTTLLASGGVFWAAAEPMYHYMNTPPIFGGGEFNNEAGAFGHAFMHWGFVAWAILGTLSTIDRKSTRLNSSHVAISYAVFCLQKTRRTHSDHVRPRAGR